MKRNEKIVINGLIKGINIVKCIDLLSSYCKKHGIDNKIIDLYEKMADLYGVKKANRKILRVLKKLKRKNESCKRMQK